MEISKSQLYENRAKAIHNTIVIHVPATPQFCPKCKYFPLES